MHQLIIFHELSFLFFKVKVQLYFVSSSYMFLDKKTLLKIWLNPGLNLTIFRGTRPCCRHNLTVVSSNCKVALAKILILSKLPELHFEFSFNLINLNFTYNAIMFYSYCNQVINKATEFKERQLEWISRNCVLNLCQRHHLLIISCSFQQD